MSLFTFATVLAVAVFTAWWLVNAAYDADNQTGCDMDTADRIRHATRCRPGYTLPMPGVSRACRPAHDTVRAFYGALPDHVPHAVDNRPTFLPFGAALLFVVDHPGWRLRYIGGNWRCVRG